MQILPNFVSQRNLYEARERPSKSYSWKAFMVANISVEIAWNSARNPPCLSISVELTLINGSLCPSSASSVGISQSVSTKMLVTRMLSTHAELQCFFMSGSSSSSQVPLLL